MRIFKRKKGHQEYYYIQHSLRKNGKVVTTERYIGKNLPTTNQLRVLKTEMLHKKIKDEERVFENIKSKFQKEWKRLPPFAKEKELQEIAIAFTYNTNAIEGSTITLPETREI